MLQATIKENKNIKIKNKNTRIYTEAGAAALQAPTPAF